MEKPPNTLSGSTSLIEKPKTFLYHRVPEGMRGNVLYPLNALKGVHTDLYVHEAKKYEGREHIMEQFLPTLEAAQRSGQVEINKVNASAKIRWKFLFYRLLVVFTGNQPNLGMLCNFQQPTPANALLGSLSRLTSIGRNQYLAHMNFSAFSWPC